MKIEFNSGDLNREQLNTVLDIARAVHLKQLGGEDAPAEKPTRRRRQAEPKEKPAARKSTAKKEPTPETSATLTELRKLLAEKKDDHRAAIVKELKKYGVKGLSNLDQEHYADFYEFLDEL